MQSNQLIDTFDLKFEVVDPSFRNCVFGGPRLERLFCGTRLGEGPTYFADLAILIWSDIPNNRMLRYVENQGTTLFRSPVATPTAARETGKVGSSPANTAVAGLCAPNQTEPSPYWPTGSKDAA